MFNTASSDDAFGISTAENTPIRVNSNISHSRKREDGKKGSTLRALVKTFRAEFLIAGLCKIIADGLNYSGEQSEYHLCKSFPLWNEVIVELISSHRPALHESSTEVLGQYGTRMGWSQLRNRHAPLHDNPNRFRQHLSESSLRPG